MISFVVLAVIGALLVALGAAMWAIPAGVIVLGVEALLAAYCGMYLLAQRSEVKR